MHSPPTSSSNDRRFEMEMQRLDAEIAKTRKQLHSAVLGKKRSVTRTWLEISALTNAHILQMLPYKAMLGHVANLAVERDKLIDEMVAKRNDKKEEDDRNTNTSQSETVGIENGKARDEAVQTEESFFHQKS